MPYTNEHAFRITNPDKYENFARQNDKMGDGIHAIFGIYEQDKVTVSELQSIRFDASKYSFDEAKDWIKSHNFSPIESEEATNETNQEEEQQTDDKENKDCNNNDTENLEISLPMDKKISKNYIDQVAKEFDDEEMSVIHFITTENQDRYGDVVRADGMIDKHYAKNPVVLFGHDHNSFPIGKSLWRKSFVKDGVKGILAKTKFAKTDDGKVAYELWRDGFLNSASIGFIPKKYDMITKSNSENGANGGYDFKEWELLEYSIVTVPANQEALRLAYTKSMPSQKIHRVYEEMVVDGLKKELVDLKEKINFVEEKVELVEVQQGAFQNLVKDLTEKLENLENIKTQELKVQAEITAKPLTPDLAKSLVEDAIRGVISKKV